MGHDAGQKDTRAVAPRLAPLSLLLLPILVLWRNSNPIFNNLGYIDPWVYYGFFRYLNSFKLDLFPGTYYGSRLSWVLPGYVVNRLFDPLTANYVLHLAVFYVAILSLYFILTRTIGWRTAFLTSILFGLNPYVWYAVGKDYVDGASIAYYLLAMALLTRAAQTVHARWPLFASGVCCAAMIYCNIVWVIFLPSFVAYYLYLKRAAVKSNARTDLLRIGAWMAAGALALTLVLCSLNYYLEGLFWFYGPSLRTLHSLSRGNPFTAKTLSWIGEGGWLVFPVFILLATSIFTIVQLVRRTENIAPASRFFAINFIASVALFVLAQFVGQPMLELHYYASLLLPPAFLAASALLWQVPMEWTSRRILLFGATVAIAFSAPFWDLRGFIWKPALAVGLEAIAGLAAVAMLWRLFRPASAVSLCVLLFPTLILETMAPRLDKTFLWPKWETGTELRDGFLRINDALARIRAGGAQNIRFWYNDHDPNAKEFRSLSSIYLFEYSMIGHDFPVLPAGVALQTGSVLAVLSSDPNAPALAEKALQPSRLIFKSISMYDISRANIRYKLAIVRLARDPLAMEPLSLEIDGRLSPANATAILPANNWQLAGNSGKLTSTQDGMEVTTPDNMWGYAASYNSPLIVSANGTYLFRLRYRMTKGHITFGALKDDRSVWLAQATAYPCDDPDCVAELVVPLKAGQKIWMQTANYSPAGDLASTFLIKELTAFRLKLDGSPSH